MDFPREGADGDGGRYGRESVCAGVSFAFVGGNDELADGNDELADGIDESLSGNDESSSGYDGSPGRNDESTCGNDGSSLRFIASFEPSIGSVM